MVQKKTTQKRLGGEGAGGPSRRSVGGLRVAGSALGLVAGTPLVLLSRLSPAGGAKVWAKCEFLNPGGSLKDRAALAMILAAEDEGILEAGSVVVEATSGNTGISLAMICAMRGYGCVLVMPEDMSMERRLILKAYGAEIELTPAERGMAGAVERAKQIARTRRGAFMARQFENEANPLAHYQGTAQEIIEQMEEPIDAFVAGVGTGGTVTGVGRALKERCLGKVQIVAVEPASSAVLSGGRPALHGIQGLGAGFIPPIVDRSVIDEIIGVPDVQAEKASRQLAHKEGLLVGPSSGANLYAALEVAQRLKSGNIVTILCDSGERYLF
ncbi:MAG: cysteine synthase A [Polyangiaceae bacterium]|nr:cysteine synthase A [Polyangiaceae bacterium]